MPTYRHRAVVTVTKENQKQVNREFNLHTRPGNTVAVDCSNLMQARFVLAGYPKDTVIEEQVTSDWAPYTEKDI